MFLKFLAAVALLAVPASAWAQPAARAGAEQVALEIVATGSVDAVATAITLGVRYTVTADSEEALEKAAAAKLAELKALIAKAELPASALGNRVWPFGANFDAASSANVYDNLVSDTMLEPKPSRTTDWEIKLGSLERTLQLKQALQSAGMTADITSASLPDQAPFQRQAKAKALDIARADAAAYAAQLGLRVVRIARISEAGEGLLPPGIASKLGSLFNTGPAMLKAMYEPKTGYVRVDASLVVEFVLAK